VDPNPARVLIDCHWRTALVHEKEQCDPEVHLKGDDESNGCRWPILHATRNDLRMQALQCSMRRLQEPRISILDIVPQAIKRPVTDLSARANHWSAQGRFQVLLQ
jgi:hypothetical protein